MGKIPIQGDSLATYCRQNVPTAAEKTANRFFDAKRVSSRQFTSVMRE
jgi:hypothetical protein